MSYGPCIAKVRCTNEHNETESWPHQDERELVCESEILVAGLRVDVSYRGFDNIEIYGNLNGISYNDKATQLVAVSEKPRSGKAYRLNMVMGIKVAESDEDIDRCFTIMRDLRPHIAKNEFVSRVRVQHRQGYRLAFVEIEEIPVVVAGFRIADNLAWGRFLYVDDLVTLPEYRSMGYGAALLYWIENYAISEGCNQIHLDSGLERVEAHRFYRREAMKVTGFHFVKHV